MKTTLLILATHLFAMFAHAEVTLTFTTLDGRAFKNVTISKVEPSGLQVMTDDGIERVPFSQLPEDIQKRFRFDAGAAAAYDAKVAEMQQRTLRDAYVSEQAKRNAETSTTEPSSREIDSALESISIIALIEPHIFGKEKTTARIQPMRQRDTGDFRFEGLNIIPIFEWIKDGPHFTGVISERMPEQIESGEAIPATLYKIGHTEDKSREPLFTLLPEKARKFVLEQLSASK